MASEKTEIPAMARLMRETRYAKGEEPLAKECETKEKGAPAAKPERLLSA